MMHCKRLVAAIKSVFLLGHVQCTLYIENDITSIIFFEWDCFGKGDERSFSFCCVQLICIEYFITYVTCVASCANVTSPRGTSL